MANAHFHFRFPRLPFPLSWFWLSCFFFLNLIRSSVPIVYGGNPKPNDPYAPSRTNNEISDLGPMIRYCIIAGVFSFLIGVLAGYISYWGFVLRTPGPKVLRVWCVVFAVFDVLAGGVGFGVMLGLDLGFGKPWRFGLAHPFLMVGLGFQFISGVWRLVLAWNKWEKEWLVWIWILPVVPSLLSPFTYLSLPPSWQLIYIIRRDCRIRVRTREDGCCCCKSPLYYT